MSFCTDARFAISTAIARGPASRGNWRQERFLFGQRGINGLLFPISANLELNNACYQ